MDTRYFVAKWEHWNMGKQTFVECPSAKPITIPDFEEFKFFVHRELIYGDQWAKKNWRISEATTGLMCGGNESPTIQGCVELTKNILNRIGKDKFPMYVNNAPKSPFCEV